MIIFDIEIANPIAPENPADREIGLFYAKDFKDYENMGIACIAAYDYATDKYHVFGEYELDSFKKLVDSTDKTVGYNNIRFDNNVLAASQIVIPSYKSYDILAEIYSALGSRQKGCRLDDVVKANFPSEPGKNGDGAKAPIRWQRGYHCEVINYCLNDVRLTKKLLDKIIRTGSLVSPLDPGKLLKINRP